MGESVADGSVEISGGVIDEDVEASVVRLDPVDHPGHCLGLTHIRLDGCHLCTELSKCSRGTFEVLGLPARDRHRRPRCRKRRRDTKTDTRSSPGNHGDLTGQEVGAEDAIGQGTARAASRNSGPCSAWICDAPSIASTCSSAPSSPARTRRLIVRLLAGAPLKSCSVIARTPSSIAASSTTWSTNPRARARAASIVSPASEKAQRRSRTDQARQRERRASIRNQSHSGKRGGKRRSGSGDTEIAGHGQVEPEPRPVPCTTAMTGTGQRTIASTAD